MYPEMRLSLEHFVCLLTDEPAYQVIRQDMVSSDLQAQTN